MWEGLFIGCTGATGGYMKNLEQLPSGAWRYRKKINGKVIRITFDHQPTENVILMSIGDYLGDAPAPKEMLTFENAAKQYVELKRNPKFVH